MTHHSLTELARKLRELKGQGQGQNQGQPDTDDKQKKKGRSHSRHMSKKSSPSKMEIDSERS